MFIGVLLSTQIPVILYQTLLLTLIVLQYIMLEVVVDLLLGLLEVQAKGIQTVLELFMM
jgi:hypothetical protein